jgi:hypothetical protein
MNAISTSKGYFVILLIFVFLLGIMMTGCGKKDSKISYSKLKENDLETIDYINQNSDCYFKLLDEMNVTDKSPDAPYTESSPGYGEITSYGVSVSGKDAPIVTEIYINNKPSEYNILGVCNGDTYKDARSELEAHGFKWDADESFNSYTTVSSFSKGTIKINLYTDSSESNNTDDNVVFKLGVIVPIKEE